MGPAKLTTDLSTWYLGIDPGKTGAMAALNGKGEIVGLHDWSDIWDMSAELSVWARDNRTVTCVLELVHAMPKQGVKSMFEFGRNVGMWQAALAIHRISYQEVTPQKWQKALGLVKRDGGNVKDQARIFAMKTWPNDIDLFRRKKDSGRIDALCMALYALRTHRTGQKPNEKA